MSSGPVTELPLKSVDVPYSDLEKQNEGINHHIAGTIAILEIEGMLYVLLVQRPEEGTWAGAWEVPSASHEEKDNEEEHNEEKPRTIVDTAIDATKQETGFVFDRESVLETVYRDTFHDPKYPEQNNATHYVVVKQKFDKMPDLPYHTKNQNGGLFSEDGLVCLASCTDEDWTDGKGGEKFPQAKENGHFVMLERKKEVIRKAFQAAREVE